MTEYMGRVRAWGAVMLSQHSAAPDERSRLAAYLGLAQRELAGMRETLDKAYAADTDIKDKLEKPYLDAERLTKAVMELADKEIIRSEALSYPSQDYVAALTQAIDAQFALANAVDEQLDGALHGQIQRLAAKKYYLLTAVFFLFVLCVVLALLIVRNVTRSAKFMSASLGKLAAGDLTIEVPKLPGRDELILMQCDLHETLERLSQLITQVRGAADSLSSASVEVDATSQSLIQSSSEQAASMEETAASVEQMSAAISRNAENARVTDGMAAQAVRQATEGGAAVSETVNAMKQIAAKVGIIDAIAYQTNLLALNAAIEAARAG